jgi:fatty-acyl-CoA synthase
MPADGETDGYMEIRDRIKDVITEDELTAFVRDRIAHYKVPSGVTFVTELPKTATGEIQKFVLRGGATNISRQ